MVTGIVSRLPRVIKGLVCVKIGRTEMCKPVEIKVRHEKGDGYIELVPEHSAAEAALEQLENKYDGEGYYKCPYCGARFNPNSSDLFSVHVLIHELNRHGILTRRKELKCVDTGWGYLCLHRRKWPMVLGWYGDEDSLIIIEDKHGLEHFIEDAAKDLYGTDVSWAFTGGLEVITMDGRELKGEEALHYLKQREKEVTREYKQILKTLFRQ